MIGVNITCELNQKIERGAEAARRTKSDFLRLILEKGSKAVHSEQTQLLMSPRDEAGFMLAPLLFMLALGGIGAAVMFSGYSQVLRSNAEMTAINAVRQQLNSTVQTLSANSKLISSGTQLQPPAVYALGSVADTARLPATADASALATYVNTGAPAAFGVLDPNSGTRQLDPWGKYYIYCNWNGAITPGNSSSITVISAGPDGVLKEPLNSTPRRCRRRWFLVETGCFWAC